MKKTLPALMMSVTLAVGLTLTGSTATANQLDQEVVTGLEGETAMLQALVRDLEVMSIQLEASKLDRAITHRFRLLDYSSFIAQYLRQMDDLQSIESGMTSSMDGLLSMATTFDSLFEKLEAENDADMARLAELAASLPENIELSTPRLDEAGLQAYANLEKYLGEADDGDK